MDCESKLNIVWIFAAILGTATVATDILWITNVASPIFPLVLSFFSAVGFGILYLASNRNPTWLFANIAFMANTFLCLVKTVI